MQRYRALGSGLAGLAIAGLALAGLTGCQTLGTTGESVLSAELERVRTAGTFQLLEVDSSEAHVTARGREVVLVPVSGLCLTAEGIDISESGVFAVIADCVTEQGLSPAGTDADGDTVYRLPPLFPGLMTVSVSEGPLFEEGTGSAEGVRRLRAFLASEEGLALLGRNGSGETVELIESVPMGDGVYVHVRDTHSGELALLAPAFWRAFVEINDRLVLVTVSGFRDRPLSDDTMLAVLAAQVTELRDANGLPLYVEEERLAGAAARYLADRGPELEVAEPVRVASATAEGEAHGEGERLDGIGGGAPAGAPAPGGRVRVEIPTGPVSARAPSNAPSAPSRP